MNKFHDKIIFFLYFIFLTVGIYIFKDFGLGLEESFQRASGFYWLTYITDLLNLESLKTISENKYKELYSLNQNLPRVINNPAYGIILDVPVALLEIFLDFDKNINNINLKHFLIFFTFFLSTIFFGKLIKKRYSNFYVTFFGLIVYFFSPKIFGASFFDGKDLFFLSIFTITIYFFQNFLNKNTFISLLLFAAFSAFSTSSRIFGLFIPLSFILMIIFKLLCDIEIKKNIKILSIYISSYVIFLFLHWPYLWNLSSHKIKLSGANIKVFFDGNYYDNLALPLSYIPKLITISTPIFIIFFFIIGLFLVSKRLFGRLINIKDNAIKNYFFDLWRSERELLDFFILLLLGQTVFSYLTFNVHLYSSWRHFLFFHFFLIYFFSFFIYYFTIKFKKYSNVFYILLLIFNFEMVYKSYVFHPFQYNYFNNLISKNKKLLYERDTAHLGRYYALKDIIKDININNSDKNIIKIGSASWSPLEDVLYMFEDNDLKKFSLTGTNDLIKADYIYTNYIYELNFDYNNKYKIPKNFSLHKSVYKNDTLMYSIFKKK